tara:strand:- start:228 stop:758 length:531 start_codon:yes stop_codon:yes gene_type:complete
MHTLLEEMYSFQNEIALRNNASAASVAALAEVGKDYFTSIAGGLLTLGEIHAPLMQTHKFISRCSELNYENEIKTHLLNHYKIPGWGSSFVKGEPDSVFFAVDCILEGSATKETEKRVTKFLHNEGLMLYPNASYYTVACCIESGVPIEEAAFHLVNARLPAWTELWKISKKKGLR